MKFSDCISFTKEGLFFFFALLAVGGGLFSILSNFFLSQAARRPREDNYSAYEHTQKVKNEQ